MTASEPIQRVRIYLNERDTYEGQPLYRAVLEWLRREGATGATALRGIAGFGAKQQLTLANSASATPAAPIVIEWIDRAERITRLLPGLDDMLPDALISIEELRVYRAVIRSSGPFGRRPVSDVMQREPSALPADAPLTQAVQYLLEQPIAPVVNSASQVVGMITAAEVERRTELPPVRLLRAHGPAGRQSFLDALPAIRIEEAMTGDLRALSTETPIAQAVATLVEWGLESLPVIGSNGQLVGMFGIEQALQASLDTTNPAEGVRESAAPPIGLIMQGAIPTIDSTVPAGDAINRLRTVAEPFLVVLNGSTPLGILTDIGLVAALPEPALQTALVEAFRTPAAALSAALQAYFADRAVADLPLAPVPTLPIQTPRSEAIKLLIEQQLERLVVVDERSLPVGLIGRRAMLRALAQDSAG